MADEPIILATSMPGVVWVAAREMASSSPPVVIMQPYNVRAPGIDQAPSQVWPPAE